MGPGETIRMPRVIASASGKKSGTERSTNATSSGRFQNGTAAGMESCLAFLPFVERELSLIVLQKIRRSVLTRTLTLVTTTVLNADTLNYSACFAKLHCGNNRDARRCPFQRVNSQPISTSTES